MPLPGCQQAVGFPWANLRRVSKRSTGRSARAAHCGGFNAHGEDGEQALRFQQEKMCGQATAVVPGQAELTTATMLSESVTLLW